MHADARLNAKAAGKPLFYIPAVDSLACRMGRADYDDMRAFPNISTTAKLIGILRAHIGMDPIWILYRSYMDPYMDLYMDRIWIPIWILYGSLYGSNMHPIWILHGSLCGS